jgi:hypothetical protein
MARVNFRQQKRQRELARKERQSQRLLRRGEKPVDEATDVPVKPADKPAGEAGPVGESPPAGDSQ